MLTRRHFCRLGAAFLPAFLPGLGLARAISGSQRPAASRESRNYFGGFRVGIQSSIYRNLTLDEAIGKAAALGLRYLELSPAHADFAGSDTAQLRDSKRRLLDAGLSVHTYGILTVRENGERHGLERVFRHAQEFGLPTLVLDPALRYLKDIDRLAARYKVNAAIHNSSGEERSSAYSSPEQVWQAMEGYSTRLGAAVDTGDFLSAGHDPVAAIEKLKDRILDVHLKDISRPGVTCALGNGKLDVAAVLRALRALQYDRVVILEYDRALENPDDAVSASLEYLRKLTGGK